MTNNVPRRPGRRRAAWVVVLALGVAFAVADGFSRKALDSLAALGPDGARDSLEGLVSFLVRRSS